MRIYRVADVCDDGNSDAGAFLEMLINIMTKDDKTK